MLRHSSTMTAFVSRLQKIFLQEDKKFFRKKAHLILQDLRTNFPVQAIEL